MGVLPQSVPATEYLPYSFTSEMGLPLLRGATFSNEVFLRGKQEDIFCSLGGQPAGFLAEALKKILEEREVLEIVAVQRKQLIWLKIHRMYQRKTRAALIILLLLLLREGMEMKMKTNHHHHYHHHHQ